MSVRLVAGEELPELVKHPTTRQLVQYTGASGDFYEIHYDKDFAISTGLPGVILHGLLKAGFLAQLVTASVGGEGRLKSFELSYRGLDLPDRPCRCRGRVTGVSDRQADLEVWTEDAEGNRTTTGKATVELMG
jgi:hydroxyacyl-ACP dehydratase HTD2-like protein with hotdog domain